MEFGGINSKEERRAAEEVLSIIEWAFRNTPLPTEQYITRSDPKFYLEPKRIEEAFGGVAWNSLSAKVVGSNPTALNELIVSAFRYYLPAYMWWSLKNPNELFSLSGSVIFVLTRPSEAASDTRKKNYDARMESFSLDEVEAIKSYLLHLEHFYAEDFFDENSPSHVLANAPIFKKLNT